MKRNTAMGRCLFGGDLFSHTGTSRAELDSLNIFVIAGSELGVSCYIVYIILSKLMHIHNLSHSTYKMTISEQVRNFSV